MSSFIFLVIFALFPPKQGVLSLSLVAMMNTLECWVGSTFHAALNYNYLSEWVSPYLVIIGNDIGGQWLPMETIFQQRIMNLWNLYERVFYIRKDIDHLLKRIEQYNVFLSRITTETQESRQYSTRQPPISLTQLHPQVSVSFLPSFVRSLLNLTLDDLSQLIAHSGNVECHCSRIRTICALRSTEKSKKFAMPNNTIVILG
jgi:hypothetical protein